MSVIRSVLCVVIVSALGLAPACGGGSSSDPDGGSGDGGVGPDATPPSALVTCPDAVPAATSGICDATAGTGTAVLLRGTVLGDGTVYENGSVLYDGDTITCVGCDCASAAGASTATRVDCAGAVISPGLINPHDHLRFTEGTPIDTGTTRYEHRHDWRGSLSTPGNPHGSGDTSAGMQWGELRMMFSGVTSIIGKGGARGLVRNLDVLASAERSLGLKQASAQTFSLGDSGETFRANCGWNYRDTELEVAGFDAYLPHVAEGINNYAAEEFRCQSTSFDNGNDITEKNVAQIHSIGLNASDYYRMALDQAKIIWSPRSNISLYGTTAQVATFAQLGGLVALGTDWTYSGSANMQRELACADGWNRDYLNGYFSDEELWKMATINAAIATGNDAVIGSLTANKLADIAVFRAAAGQYHRAVLESDNKSVALVIRDGDVLYGEADTLVAMGEACDAVTVCGETRAVCTTRELGATFAAIESAVTSGKAAYAAIFCDAKPAGEPTCVPSRPGEYTGARGGSDADGDGIDDGSDNCPNVFNPIRPIDGGKQLDADGDGTGDACDPTPIPDDLDGDTVANASDNCPFDSNTPQTDGDTDNKGDVCDFCPQQSNPNSLCMGAPPETATIADIQQNVVTSGTRVSLSGVIVTSAWSSGVTVQQPTGAPEYSGLYIYTNSSAGVAVGDIVDVVGSVTEFFDETELEQATVTKTGTGTPIAPTPLTAAVAADEKYEGVLVRITDAAVTNAAYDCSVDGATCADANLWEINGLILVYDRAYQDADWAARTSVVPVDGVMRYRFNRRRITPRTTADFGN